MKRSRQITLVLSGTLAGSMFSGCEPSWDDEANLGPTITAANTYTNNHYVHGAGYYHAPYRAWYPFPYNYYDPVRGYYHGGQWAPRPNNNTVTASQPTVEAAKSAQTKQQPTRSVSSTRRGGFGSSSHSTSS